MWRQLRMWNRHLAGGLVLNLGEGPAGVPVDLNQAFGFRSLFHTVLSQLTKQMKKWRQTFLISGALLCMRDTNRQELL